LFFHLLLPRFYVLLSLSPLPSALHSSPLRALLVEDASLRPQTTAAEDSWLPAVLEEEAYSRRRTSLVTGIKPAGGTRSWILQVPDSADRLAQRSNPLPPRNAGRVHVASTRLISECIHKAWLEVKNKLAIDCLSINSLHIGPLRFRLKKQFSPFWSQPSHAAQELPSLDTSLIFLCSRER
jgi:hypothetical protein